jgi:uncharacterized membrane protein YfcA
VNTPARSLFRDIGIGLLVGIFSGLFGVGGGVILVPLLVLLFAVEQKRAQATSLVVVALAAVSGAVTYAFGFSVVWEAVPFLVAGGLIGTWVGSAMVVRIATRWLQLGFALVLLVAAARLVFLSLGDGVLDIPSLGVGVITGYLVAGLAMGLLSSLLGVGGGIIVVPLLVTFFGFSQQLAQGTSLVVMVPIALLGAWRLTASGFTQWGQGIRIGLAAATGAIGGATVALVVTSSALQVGFAALLVFASSQLVRKALKR